MNATWPRAVSITESPSTNSSLLIPSALLVPAQAHILCKYCLCYKGKCYPAFNSSEAHLPERTELVMVV